MALKFYTNIKQRLSSWFLDDREVKTLPKIDFDRLKEEIKPGDVILVEGTARVSEIIKYVTKSNWSHAALYIGRLDDIKNKIVREKVRHHYNGNEESQLLIEGQAGLGTIAVEIEKYEKFHVRICRPTFIAEEDIDAVIAYCAGKLGVEYNMRQIMDLLRYYAPLHIAPSKINSVLYKNATGTNNNEICSTVIAEAFHSVSYPICPFRGKNENGIQEIIHKSPLAIVPSDFDYSPYFSVIKYAPFNLDVTKKAYKNLNWSEEGLVKLSAQEDALPLEDPEEPSKKKRKHKDKQK